MVKRFGGFSGSNRGLGVVALCTACFVWVLFFFYKKQLVLITKNTRERWKDIHRRKLQQRTLILSQNRKRKKKNQSP